MFDAPAPTDTMPEAVELPQVPVRPLAAQNYFFGNLIEAIQDKGCRIYKLNALPELYVSPTEKSYYFAVQMRSC